MTAEEFDKFIEEERQKTSKATQNLFRLLSESGDHFMTRGQLFKDVSSWIVTNRVEYEKDLGKLK